MVIEDCSNTNYDPKKDFTPKGKKEIYRIFNSFLKSIDKNKDISLKEKIEFKKIIYKNMEDYEIRYDNYYKNLLKNHAKRTSKEFKELEFQFPNISKLEDTCSN